MQTEIKDPSAENPWAVKGSLLSVVLGQNVALHAVPADRNAAFCGSFSFVLLPVLFKHSVSCAVNSESGFYL